MLRSTAAQACHAQLPDLITLAQWQSKGRSCHKEITIVTQCSLDRIGNLMRMCHTWHGAISAAVYLPLSPQSGAATAHAAMEHLDRWHSDNEKLGKSPGSCSLSLTGFCMLDITLQAEIVEDEAAHLYPINALRNRALQAAQTEVLLLLDVDFMVSHNLNSAGLQDHIYQAVQAEQLLVLPAFEASLENEAGQQLVDAACAGSKDAAQQLMLAGQLRPFHGLRFVPGHGQTDYGRWLSATAPYPVQYEEGFEPYVLVSKTIVPWYDERFAGYLLVVHPEAFVVHYPHSYSASELTVKADAALQHKIQESAAELKQLMQEPLRYLPPTMLSPCPVEGSGYHTPAMLHEGSLLECSKEEPAAGQSAISPLWGIQGESFKPDGYISKGWAKAGYREGQQPPLLPVLTDLKHDWGAVGDGIQDDTEALLRAIAATQNGAIYLPAGTYKLTAQVNITHPVVLRGASRSETTLLFPHSLTDMFGNTFDHRGFSQWSFRPGLINFVGDDPVGDSTLFAMVTSPARRGDDVLRIRAWLGHMPVAGDYLRLVQSDPPEGPHAGSLINHLHGSHDVIGPDVPEELQGRELVGTKHAAQLVAVVRSVTADQVQLDRPLPFGVQPVWDPQIHLVRSSLTEAGIEDMTIQFPDVPYTGHFKEAGYNALYFHRTHHCWARNVAINNADYGLQADSTFSCLFDSVSLTGDGGRSGHHGIDLAWGSHNLVSNFVFSTSFIHDVSTEWFTNSNVFSSGSAPALNLDMHRAAAFSNLFTNLSSQASLQLFDSSGAQGRGPHAAAHNMFWNIQSDDNQCVHLPDPGFGPNQAFVGIDSCTITPTSPLFVLAGWHLEPSKVPVWPLNLFTALHATAS
eukprot:jgi/Astpho2/7152/Aster-x1419